MATAAWDRWTHTAALWSVLGGTTAGTLLDSVFTRLQMALEASGANTPADPTILAAWVRTGGRTAGLLVVCPVKDASDERMFAHALRMDEATMARIRNGEQVAHTAMGERHALHMSLRDGLVLAATDPATLEAALFRLADPAPMDSNMLEARRTFGTGVDAHLLVQLPVTQGLLGAFLRAEVADAMHWPSGMAALDVRVRPEALLLSGVIIGGPGQVVLGENALQPIMVPRVLPEAVHMLSARHVPPDSLMPEGLDAPLLDGPLLSGIWHRGDTACTTNVWRVHGSDRVSDALKALRRADPACDSLDHRGITLYRPGNVNMLRVHLGLREHHMERPWCALYGEKLVLSPEASWLREAVDAWMDGTSLAEDGRTTAFIQQHGIAAENSWWCDVGRSQVLLNSWSDTTLQRMLATWEGTLSGLGGFLLQRGTDALGNRLISVCLQGATQPEAPSAALWSTDIGAALLTGPFPVRNHANNSREVLVQDEQFRLHLIGGTGQILWTRPLEGAIQGAVHQVDRFRNGKLQLLFNTAERVHLIDRNGKDLEGFPYVLAAPATAPLAVFDYENKRDYRVLIPLADGRVLNFGLDGKATQGWSPPKLTGPCRFAVRHLRTGTQDHLFLLPDDGTPLVMDRRGAPRPGAQASFPALFALLDVQAGVNLGGVTLTWQDSSGAAFRTRLDGGQELMAPAGALTGTAMLADLDGDARAELITTRGDSLVAWNAGSMRVLRTFGTPLRLEVHHAPMAAMLGFFVAAEDRDRMHLVDAGGQDQPGSPFTGGKAAARWNGTRSEGFDLVTVNRNGRVIAWKRLVP